MTTNSPIFLFNMNFDKSTIILHFLIMSILEKFLEDQKSIAKTSIKCLNFKFFLVLNVGYTGVREVPH